MPLNWTGIMNQTLIIIDVQNGFPTVNGNDQPPIRKFDPDFHDPQLAKSIRRLVAANKRAGNPVLLVEYTGEGPTIPPIKKMLVGYPHQSVAKKSSNGGGREVVKALKKLGWPMGKMVVCGIYADACVEETVEGITELLPKANIIIPINAVMSGSYHLNKGLSGLSKMKNVRIRMAS